MSLTKEPYTVDTVEEALQLCEWDWLSIQDWKPGVKRLGLRNIRSWPCEFKIVYCRDEFIEPLGPITESIAVKDYRRRLSEKI